MATMPRLPLELHPRPLARAWPVAGCSRARWRAYAPLTLTGPDTMELLAKAPDPAAAARLTVAQISAALKRARRHDVAGKARQSPAALPEQHLGQPEILPQAYPARLRASAPAIAPLNKQGKRSET